MRLRLALGAVLALVGCGKAFEPALFSELDAGSDRDAADAPDAIVDASSEPLDSQDEASSPDAADADAAPDASPDDTGACAAISVQSAVYAASCDAATDLPTIGAECNGLAQCEYVMSLAKDPGSDVAPGCWKDLAVAYNCVGPAGVESKSVYLPKTWDNLIVGLTCECG